MRSIRSWLAAILALAGSAVPLVAENYTLELAGRRLGTLSYTTETAANGPRRSLATQLDNTPLGVADGSFVARAAPGPEGISYSAVTDSPRKTRRIAVTLRDGRATQVAITPEAERTALSDPAQVPQPVIDPVTAFARLRDATDCPDQMRIYDGRRVVLLRTRQAKRSPTALKCQMEYLVTSGPGHLAPFRFQTLRLDLTYGIEGGHPRLDDLAIGAGPFVLHVLR